MNRLFLVRTIAGAGARTCARGREKDVYLYFRKELYLFSFIEFVFLIADETLVVFFFISAYFMSYWMYIAFTYLFRNIVIIHMRNHLDFHLESRVETGRGV